jgi:DNA-binding CsgD family transcriptional regulator
MLWAMESVLDLPKPRFQLEHAIALVRQDRWLVGAVRSGKLKVLTDSSPEPSRPYRRTRPLTHLARRSLHERRPLTVSAVVEHGEPPGPPADWELDWPALLYAPVGLPGQRPVGLLIVGSRVHHWYSQQEIDYVAALGVTLSGLVLSLSGRLTRLTERELEAARLIAQGLSLSETSAALRVDPEETRTLVGHVLRKLSLRSPGQLADAWSRVEALAGYS